MKSKQCPIDCDELKALLTVVRATIDDDDTEGAILDHMLGRLVGGIWKDDPRWIRRVKEAIESRTFKRYTIASLSPETLKKVK